MRLLFFMIMLLQVSCWRVGAQQVIWDSSTPGVVRRAILVSEADFSLANLEALSRKIVNENPVDTLIDIRIVTQETQANLFPRPNHLLYKDLVRFHTMLSKMNWQFANLVSIQGRATLRIRDRQEIVRKVLADSSDPLIWKVNDDSFEIVYLSYSHPAIVKRINVFAIAQDDFSEAACRQLFSMLKRALPKGFGYLAVRRDPWFMDEEFPIFFWFHSGQPPSRAEIDKASMVKCAEINGSLDCWSYGLSTR